MELVQCKMKYFAIIVPFIFVLSLEMTSGQWDLPHESEEDNNRIWNMKPSSNPQMMPLQPLSAPDDPCDPYKPPVPNFNVPGRRISEVKCFEYIWRMKNREIIAQRENDCAMSDSISYHIIGGNSTSPGEYPNMLLDVVQLYMDVAISPMKGAIGWKAVVGTWKFLCGSSLISSKFVLTAAHCSRAVRDTTIVDIAPKIIRFGVRNIQDSKWAIDVNINKVIVHPQYKSPKHYFDIALMELVKEVTFSMDVQPACLWTKGDPPPGMPEVAGWGVVDADSPITSNELLSAHIDLVDFTTCNQLLRPSCNRNWCGLQDHQICAGKLDGGVDACQGDSGGPLQVKIPLPITSQGAMHYVIGVTSFGIGCALPGLPGVYTKVSRSLHLY